MFAVLGKLAESCSEGDRKIIERLSKDYRKIIRRLFEAHSKAFLDTFRYDQWKVGMGISEDYLRIFDVSRVYFKDDYWMIIERLLKDYLKII